jgi:hypothetical protein
MRNLAILVISADPASEFGIDTRIQALAIDPDATGERAK